MFTDIYRTEEIDTGEIAEALTQDVEIMSPSVFKQYLADSMPLVLNFCVKLIIAVIVLLVGIQIIKLIMRLAKKAFDKSKLDEGLKQFLQNLLKLFLYFALIMVVLARFGITASSVIAIVGSVGLSVGLALQGSLSNFAGGVLILLLKPFKVGDYIIEDNHKNEGTVTEIQLFYTKLLTIDNKTVILPNGALSNGSLTNVTMQNERRLDLEFMISYDADLRKAKEVIRRELEKEPSRLPEQEILVYVSELSDSSVVIGTRMWVLGEEYWPARWRILENVKLALDEHHISIPYPQMDVHVTKKNGKK